MLESSHNDNKINKLVSNNLVPFSFKKQISGVAWKIICIAVSHEKMLRAKYQSELNKLKVEEKYMKLIASHLKDQINRLKVRTKYS